MKFTDGYWLDRPQYEIQSPKEIFDYHKTDNQLTLYAPFKYINERGDELNLGMSTIELTSPVEGVIGVKLIHFDQPEKGPSFQLENEHPQVEIKTGDKELSFTSGDLTAKMPFKSNFEIDFLHKGKEITKSMEKAQGVILDRSNNKHYMREQLSMGVDELIYGLGERFTALVKNGQSVDIVNKDGGTGSEEAYKNIPFYLSSEGYGVFVDQPETVSFEIASENVDRTQFSVEGQSLQYYIIDGPTPKDVLNKYTRLTGQVGLPPAWSFGLWLSTSFTTDYSEETVLKFIDGMRDRKIPLDVFHFDCFWQKGFEWSTLLWDKEQFPDPEGLIKKIHDRGIKVCVWINPYIAQKSYLFKEGRDKGYLIKREDGNVWQWDLWQAGNGFVDFTNPDAVKWYQSKLKDLLDMGVDCFKTDFGERIPVEDAVFFDGSDPKREHNYYTYQYNQTVFDLIKQEKGEDQAVVFARSATVGSQKFPLHWGGDNLSRYKSMADSLRGGLSFLTSGFGFWAHDISGFEEQASPDLYKRWTQFGLMSSHSRYHGSGQYKVPWVFDEEAVDNTRKFVNLKLSLMPYLFNEAVNTHETGTPLMRPVFMEYTNDRNTYYLEREYMFGPKLLVAPIFNAEGNVKYYVPEGKWTNLLTEKTYDLAGGTWLEENYDNLTLPVLVRENSIILRNQKAEHAEYNYADSPEIHIYELADGNSIKTRVVDQKANDVGSVSATRSGNSITVEANGLTGSSKIFVHESGKVQEFPLTDSTTKITL
ncbi:alpha-xylosidase [Companilactobacillus sp.]|jgi:alpha-D-xyloside xylohydrolase|uniref:alpha-xylosidase n=1 Tax=Companilactobacillus sp. TaxID=2767905 RepID=UPI0025C0BFE7|nr:alpha-xylosidase [Companilactobacillus sp.]MCH4009228.1 alpha-xylosidase [Companilactobacillus sp.]MCH4050593.1 alpha-xylosidase [Companilactobacillus sp.]MCH4077170.1 alpha-xylosidase [Companilactobacillus sp.]MCH4125746.1 alpha-xylosidase [Companilactobacillus sp.]MCI1311455.1 alpha-xylosidase [Companilactobacillus sp.]